MLEKPLGGRGILLGGVPGVAAAKVMVIGGGVVGMNAAFIAIGMGADVYVYDRNIDRLRELDDVFGGRARPCYASTLEIEQRLPRPTSSSARCSSPAPRRRYVIRARAAQADEAGAVLVDVAIDQGGCFETSRADDPLRPDLRGRRRSPTTASPTCRARCRSRRPTRSPTRRCPTCCALADAASRAALRATPGLPRGVNVAPASVTYGRSPRRSGCRTRDARSRRWARAAGDGAGARSRC